MDLIVRREVAAKLQGGFDALAPWGVPRSFWENRYNDKQSAEINLRDLTKEQFDALRELWERHPNVKGIPVLLNDMALWEEAIRSGHEGLKARTVRQFETILQQYLLKAPRQHLYKRLDENSVVCYWVGSVKYSPPYDTGQNRRPAQVTMDLHWWQFGQRRSTSVTFYDDDCRGIPVGDALLEKGYAIENKVLRDAYERDFTRWKEHSQAIGRQFLAEGFGRVHGEDRYGYSQPIQLDKFGERARVVIDVFSESGKDPSSDNHRGYSRYYWRNIRNIASYNPETDEDSTPQAEWNTLDMDEPEIPVHPWVVIFHLQKHLRMSAHIAQLEEYVYDTELAEKLVLPVPQKALVKMLIDTKGGAFQDIVAGKGGGAVVLLSGPPGTGKTLTAEVYAESEQRPLYSVQCSQLGTDPAKLESELMRVFDRARRWDAVMLLDEADVYVRERGGSLQQNAIVGVFLRVLEYQASVLFLTTNRPDDVDDAIGSRCIARIHYQPPAPEDAKRIWRILADLSGLTMTDATIDEVVARDPHMSGRDIKNVLKLASLYVRVGNGAEVDADVIEYAKEFKPTGSG